MQLIGGLVLDGSAGAKLEIHGVKRDPSNCLRAPLDASLHAANHYFARSSDNS